MSGAFGFSVGDFVTVGTLAWTVYKACKNAPDSFGSVSAEVLSLHALLKEVEETVLISPLSEDKQERLHTIAEGCRLVLKDLERLVERYRGLGSQTKRTWNRMKWSFENVGELRARLTANTTLLSTWLSLSQTSVERMLQDFLEEYRRGARPCSVISAETQHSITNNDGEVWKSIRDELEEAGISVAAFDANKEFIFTWLVNALKNNDFVVDEGSSDYELDLDGRQGGLHEFIHLVIPSPTFSSGSHMSTDTSASLHKFDLKPPHPMSLLEALTLGPDSEQPEYIPDIKDTISLHEALVLPDPVPEPSRFLDQPIIAVEEKPQINSVGWFSARTQNNLANTRLSMALKLNTKGNIQRILMDEGDMSFVRFPVFVKAMQWAIREGEADLVRFMLKILIKKINNGKHTVIDLIDYLSTREKDHTESDLLNAIFHFAASTRDIDAMEKALKCGVDVNAWGKLSGRTALQEAIRTGNTSVIQFLIINGADIDAWDRSSGWSVLTEAAHYGRGEIISLLLENGAEITSSIFTDTRSPLYQAVLNEHPSIIRLLAESMKGSCLNDGSLNLAAQKGDLSTVQLLLDLGADANYISDKGGFSAICLAASAGHDSVVKVLLEKRADPNLLPRGVSTKSITSPLATALKNGHYTTAEILLSGNANPNFISPGSSTPALCFAIRIGHSRLIQCLLDHGADPNVCPIHNALPPLALAARRGDYCLVQLLLEKGAYPDQRSTKTQMPPLSLAVLYGSSRIVRILLEAGADVNMETREVEDSGPKQTALSLAVEHQQETVVSLLLKEGAAIPPETLYYAVSKGDYRMVQYLLVYGAQDVDRALFYACEYGHLDVVQLLLDNNANINGAFLQTSSIHRCTPLHSASANGHIKIARYLLQRGASPDGGCNSTCSTPIMLATQHSHEQVVWLLLEYGATVTDCLLKEARRGKRDSIVKLLKGRRGYQSQF